MSAARFSLRIALSLCALVCVTPQAASAYATIAPPPTPSPASGLPDGRVYELVSPADKYGYQAGAIARDDTSPFDHVQVRFSVASPDGDAVAYGSEGPVGDVNAAGLNKTFVAERTLKGWKSRSTEARGLEQAGELSLLAQTPNAIDYTPDLSHMAYVVKGAQVPGAPHKGYQNIYLMGSNPLEAPTWLMESVAGVGSPTSYTPEIVGMTPDASVVYIAYQNAVLPQDAARVPGSWGLYAYRAGALTEVGVLPDGNVPAAGAQPVATSTYAELSASDTVGRPGENDPASLDNQLSEDGRRLFFVSSGQVYVHEMAADGGERSILVSASHLPGHVGEPALDGAVLFENMTRNDDVGPIMHKNAPTYAYASSDGSHVFFQSSDQLTSDAPSGPGLKAYDFSVDTEALEYLPGVALRGIAAATKDGKSFAFVDNSTTPQTLDLWSAGNGGGKVTQIAQLPGEGFVGPARFSADGSVFVFQAQAPIAGFNDAESEQIYRYDTSSNELGCVSCPPAGVRPSGGSYLSVIDQHVSAFYPETTDQSVNDDRGISADGSRVFFASPDPLVSRDTNGDYDTYEWENGKVLLISSGTSANYSLFLDNSESGGDVFFATSDELVPGDNDAGFDVYDARIPRPGDNPPPAAVPCSGEVCQGPPSVPNLLGSPPSATFNGAENLTEQPYVKAKSTPKRLTNAQKRSQALRVCRKLASKPKRHLCERRARKRYPSAGAAATHDRAGGKS